MSCVSFMDGSMIPPQGGTNGCMGVDAVDEGEGMGVDAGDEGEGSRGSELVLQVLLFTITILS